MFPGCLPQTVQRQESVMDQKVQVAMKAWTATRLAVRVAAKAVVNTVTCAAVKAVAMVLKKTQESLVVWMAAGGAGAVASARAEAGVEAWAVLQVTPLLSWGWVMEVALATVMATAMVAAGAVVTVEATVETMVEATVETMVEAMVEAMVETMVEAMVEATVEATVEAMEEATEEAMEKVSQEAARE